jgi:hypothetical protein
MSSVLSPFGKVEDFLHFFLSFVEEYALELLVALSSCLHRRRPLTEKTWINIVFSRPLTAGFIRRSIPRWVARWKAWQGVVYRAAFPAHITAGWEACRNGTICEFLGIFVNVFLAKNDLTIDRRNILKAAAFYKPITGPILRKKKS